MSTEWNKKPLWILDKYIISKILLTILSDQMQGTRRYLNRHLQDFSVVLAEVRGNIRQVRISPPQFYCVHLELSDSGPSARTGRFLGRILCSQFLWEVKFLPSSSSHGPAESSSVCSAGPVEGFRVRCHENCAALLHGRVWRRLCARDRPSLSCQDRRRSSGPTSVLSDWLTAVGLTDFQHRSQGRNLQTHGCFHPSAAMTRMLF